MREMGLTGAVRGEKVRTTTPEDNVFWPTDLVRRNFAADLHNELWITDLAYVSTWRGFAYVAFIIDVFARMIVGWGLSNSLKTDLPLTALEQAIFARKGTGPLVHHSDRGSQYLSIRYTERLADADIALSVGRVGDSYDNAMAESVIVLYKTEVINEKGPWKHRQAVELSTLVWVDWFSNRRLLEPIGNIPPAEMEHMYYQDKQGQTMVA